MEKDMTFEYDEVGDILYISKVKPYPEQETEALAYNVVVRRDPQTGNIENVEVLFFTQWLLKDSGLAIRDLRALFAPRTAVQSGV